MQKSIDIETEYSQLSYFLKENNVEIPETQEQDTYKMIEMIFEKNNPATAFYIINLGDIIRQLQLWRELFPFIEPRYAVKCNPNKVICQLLGLLGVGFDVASKNEINLVKEYVGDISKVIYANPYKEPSSIQYARQMDVDTATFDSESELDKIKLYHPGCRLLIRLKVDDRASTCKFSDKFGVNVKEARELLEYAKYMRLRVEGVCFHVGSGCKNPEQYYSAIKMAKVVFNIAKSLGLKFNIIDIGGGFPGLQDTDSMELLRGIRDNVTRGLKDFFQSDYYVPGLLEEDDTLPQLELIAEPGRFFVQSSHTLLVNIVGKRVRYVPITAPDSSSCSGSPSNKSSSAAGAACGNGGSANTTSSQDEYTTDIKSSYNPAENDLLGEEEESNEGKEKVYNYYLNDGIYGSFNCLVFDHAKAEVLPYNERDGARYRSVIFGPTCDSVDKISGHVELPELEIGEWCFVKNFGAYTVAAASDFNGFSKLRAFYILS